MTKQLTLNIHFNDDATFANFYAAENLVLYNYLQNFIQQEQERCVYLWGEVGSGRSHLLQACCHTIAAIQQPVAYIPLIQYQEFSPAIFEGLENMTLICLDDVEHIVGQHAWEEALFHCYNRTLTTQAKLLIAANTTPAQLPFALPDLRSRLQAGVIFHVQPLADTEKIVALQMHAKARGMELNTDVVQFLLHRYPRDMQALFNLLEQLDKASLAAQRKLTIPFVKSVLQE